MFMRTYASSREKRKSFYRNIELQMLLLISGGHIGALIQEPMKRQKSILVLNFR